MVTKFTTKFSRNFVKSKFALKKIPAKFLHKLHSHSLDERFASQARYIRYILLMEVACDTCFATVGVQAVTLTGFEGKLPINKNPQGPHCECTQAFLWQASTAVASSWRQAEW